MDVGPKRERKGGRKERKRKKKGRNSKSFLPQLPAALSRSVVTEATAQLLQRLLLTQATVALPPPPQQFNPLWLFPCVELSCCLPQLQYLALRAQV
jgi:hypothetical protein